MERVDPGIYELPPRTVLLKDGENEFTIQINRKSRIIMKDARAILEKASVLREKVSGASIFLETTAPVCGKSMVFLNDHGVTVLTGRE